jgi:uncharacterized protein YybS (DUF2232 family)
MSAIKLHLLQRSLRAHILAWVGLIPILGMPCSFAGWMIARDCRRLQRTVPNPARRYVLRAQFLSILGILLSVVILGLMTLRATKNLH